MIFLYSEATAISSFLIIRTIDYSIYQTFVAGERWSDIQVLVHRTAFKLLVTLGMVAVTLALCWFRPRLWRRLSNRWSAVWNVFARNPAYAVAFSFFLPLLLRLLMHPFRGIPNPAVHDEFSYLLAGDTFASGRLTNPPHPLWKFFETFHVIQHPTYMSKYPPVQGLILAFGQAFLGHPWWGVFLSIGAMCAAVCWMLEAWLPTRWALLGAVAVALQFGPRHYWMESYWGGAAAAIGGCILMGAYGRLKWMKSSPPAICRSAVLLGIGVAILANSRPWEGLVFSVPVAIAFAAWVFARRNEDAHERIRAAVLPCSLVLLLTIILMMYYSWRVTGSALRHPYAVYTETYQVVPLFVWGRPRLTPTYYNREMREFHTQVEPHLRGAISQSTFRGWTSASGSKLKMIRQHYFPMASAFVLACCLPWLWRDRRFRFLLIVLAVFLAGFSLQRFYSIHYCAPILGLAAGLQAAALRRVNCLRWKGRRVGQALAVSMVVIGSLYLTLRQKMPLAAPYTIKVQRPNIQRELLEKGGLHVVVVRYSSDHIPAREWVYNAANIDASPVIWAREMAPQENSKLFVYYRNRTIWLLEPDKIPPRLEPYPL